MERALPYLFLMRVWTICLVAVAILACAPVADPQLPPGGVPRDDTQQVFSTHYSGIDSRQRLVIRDADAWQQFWSRAHSTVIPQPPAPSIDFSQNIVVAAAMGSRPTGGYTIQFEEVYQANDDVYIAVNERSPGANCILTQALTSPVAAIRVPRPGASVSFVERAETFNC